MRTVMLFAAIVVATLLLPLGAQAQPAVGDPLGEWPPSPVIGARAVDPYAPPDLQAAQAASAEGSSSWQRWPFGSPDQTYGDLTDVRWVPPDPQGAPGTPAQAWVMSVGPLDYDSAALHWDGTAWVRTPLPPSAGTVAHLAALAPNDVWAAGNSFLHWDGNAWTIAGTATAGGSDTVLALQMISPALGFAGTFGGYLYTYDGTAWTRGAKISPFDIAGIHMFDAANGWAVGQQGVLLRCQGGVWSQVYSPVAHSLSSIAFVTPTNGWIVGTSGTFLHWDGSSWTPVDVPGATNMYAVTMRTADDGWAAGDQGAIFHWDGQRWSRSAVDGQQNTRFVSISAASAADVLVAGYRGTLLRWDGHTWAPVTLVTRPPIFLNDVDVADSQLGWAVGLGGAMLRWDGHDWVEAPPVGSDLGLYGVHINDPGLTFLAGVYSLSYGDNAGNWVTQEVPEAMVSVDSVAATKTAYSAGLTFAGDSFGVIYRKRLGEDWAKLPVPQTPPLLSIRMFDDSFGIAVGRGGTILHWNGQAGTWSLATSPTTEDLYSVEMVARDDWWIVGAHGTILHGDGDNWAKVATPLPHYLYRRVRATNRAGGTPDLWISGEQGTLLHWNKLAQQWDFVPSSTANVLTGVSGVTGDATWAVGEYGTIVRYGPTYTISGKVTAALGGEGIAGVEVQAATSFDSGASVRTDAAGTYTFTAVIDGVYTITVPSPEYKVQPPLQTVSVPPSAGSIDFTAGRANSWVCWPRETPLSCVPDLVAVASTGDGTAWAVGRSGAIYFWDGSRWLRSTSPTGNDLNGVAVRTPNDVWAVGMAGTVVHFDGHAWRQVVTGDTTDLGAVAALAADDVWVAGAEGRILHWNGASWQTVPSGSQSPLLSLAMLSPTDGWAVGGAFDPEKAIMESLILHWDGTAWKSFRSPVSQPLTAVVMLSPTLGWAASGEGLLRWNGSFWALDSAAPAGAYGYIAMRTAANGWASGSIDQKSALVYWNGSSWTTTEISREQSPRALAYTGDEELVAVGANGLAGHRSGGGSWVLEIPDLGEPAVSVDATADGDAWLATLTGNVWRWNGAAWAQQGSSDAWSNVIKVYGPNDVWLGGEHGYVGHWDGAQWTNLGETTGKSIYSVQQIGPELWAAGGEYGPNPELMQWNGTAWTRPVLGDLRTIFHSIAALSPSDIWVSGNNGTMLHYDGQAWTNYPLDQGRFILSLAAKAPNDIWGVGTDGKIVHWDGTSWQDVTSPTEYQLSQLQLMADGTGWAVGWDIAHFDGQQWQLMRDPTSKLLMSLTFSSDHDGWAVGDKGVKLRFGPAYTARGTLRDTHGELLRGVALKTSQGDVVFTDLDGTYGFDDLSAGSVTITPVRKGWVFDPPSRTITAPPVAAGLDFVGRPYMPLFLPVARK